MESGFYENLSDTDRVVKTMGGIAGILSGIPLLFTIRTEKEGGKAGISPEEYEGVNLAAARSGYADLVDVEVFSCGRSEELIRRLQEAGVKVVGSAMIFRRPTAGRSCWSVLRRWTEPERTF